MGVVKRAGRPNYYLRIRRNGKIYFQSLETDNLKLARERAKIKVVAITQQKFDALDSTKSRSSQPSIDQLCARYREVAAARGEPLPKTVRGNVSKMLALVRGIGRDPAVYRVGDLSGADVLAFTAKWIKVRPAVDRDSARRTAAAIVRKAKSLLSRGMIRAYRDSGLIIPESVDRFLAEIPRAPAVQWEEPDPALVARLKASADLARVQGWVEFRVAWLLCYGLALRAGEAAACRWTWFEERNGRIWCNIRRRNEENFCPKGISGWIPAWEIWEELSRYRGKSVYVMPQEMPTARENFVLRTLAAWMRIRGWARNHTAHELRAIRINEWRKSHGLEAARCWGRHASLAVTGRHYSDLFFPG